jgi:hypothetical protein
LRALFAPDAKPLTRRDAWAPPFHDVANRQAPRTDLPDLSSYVVAVPATLTAAAVPTGAAAASAEIPAYYRDFIKQSDAVRKRLHRVQEPEMSGVVASAGIERAAQTTRAFEQAADRHRHSP